MTRKCSTLWPWPSLRLPKTPPTPMLWPSTKIAVAEYDDAQIAAFDEEAQAKHAVATMEVEGDDGEVEEQAITFARLPGCS